MTDSDFDLLPRAERRAPIERDRYGRPKIFPPGGRKPVPYVRCTTFIKCIEDTSRLEAWQKRMVLIGTALQPELGERAIWELDKAAFDGEIDKKALDELAERAMTVAKAHEKRDKGTHLHLLSEYVDLGQPLPETVVLDNGTEMNLTDKDRADMDAYVKATSGLEVTHIERFTALDEYQVAGTPDRLVKVDGRTYIADLKTGRVDYGALTIAMQLAVYSRSVFYDHVTQQREPLPGVDQDRAIVIHLPSGSGKCELHWVDVAQGWEHVQLARKVRTARNLKQRHLFSPFGGAS